MINDWLHEMRIGEMPEEGLLYDETLHGVSAEAVYDRIVKELRKFKKHATFRGFHNNGRGYIPAGLVEEIRALSMPPIPWEVKLAEWFDVQFPPLEKHRTYARPSRRQGATPDIPRPSYAVSKEVPFVRIIFCNAEATDAGYMAPEDIAGRVEVTGRGGTILQQGVNMLERAKDFPDAFLIPKGNKLPFSPKGKIFYFQ